MTQPDTAPSFDVTTDHEDEHEVPWRRLRRRMLIILPLKEIASAMWAIIGTVFLSRRANDDGPPWITLAIVALLVMLGVARWFTTSYRVTEHRFEVRTGLLKRTTTHAVRGAIRAIDTESPLLYRVLGITKVSVTTGTADTVELNAVTTDDAAALQRILGTSVGPTQRTTDAPNPDLPSTGPRPEIPLAQFSSRWLRAVPFSGAGLAASLGVLAAGTQVTRRYFSDAEVGDAMVQGVTWVENFGIVAFIAVAVVFTLAIILATSLLLYLVRFANYRLWAEPHPAGVNLRGVRGLLTTSNSSTDFARIYGVKIKDGYVARLGHVREATLLIGGRSSTTTQGAKESAHLMPLAPRDDVITVAVDTLSLGAHPGIARIYADAPRRRHRTPTPLTVSAADLRDACTRPLIKHGPRARRRLYVRGLLHSTLPLLAVVAMHVSGWLGEVPTPLWLLGASPLILAPLLAEDRYRNLGHHVSSTLLTSQSVGFTRQRTVLATHAIIGWEQRATCFQRRAGLVTLLAATSTGGEALTLRDVPLEFVPDIISVATPHLAATASRSSA